MSFENARSGRSFLFLLFLRKQKFLDAIGQILLSHTQEDRKYDAFDGKGQKIVFRPDLKGEFVLLHHPAGHLQRHQIHQVGIQREFPEETGHRVGNMVFQHKQDH